MQNTSESSSAKAKTRVKLTEFSHGAGCGCKIAPKLLEDVLQSQLPTITYPSLLVGNDSRDDAAVYDLGDGNAVISTTDFFMPIVDDPFEFGQIAATNAISDVYAMGGRPIMAIAIFGWPLSKLAQIGPEVASQVIDGGRHTCQQAGIPLAGGHSIDCPEPVFGLAVTGLVSKQHLKRNDQATHGCKLYLTKPLGIGILTTAEKKKLLKPAHARLASDTMCLLNSIGEELGRLPQVKAMTDVTGFGLLGHLIEMCQGSRVGAVIEYAAVPRLSEVEHYLALGCSPGGAQRNFDSYGHKVTELSDEQRQLLCDPQTSGGLLVAVTPEGEAAFLATAQRFNITPACIGEVRKTSSSSQLVEVI